ncbi:sensor domain-containing protein [Noviherbaspirillum galbum]|uniref:EAL domain-containing protein n=1 Tax=Noviherbaspirillum galbum TaxID=2709383 RepID=A0A6B3SQ76_9BURK|nr:bifunctional diguanylate cyclase/phosphodiesterase [Noviherbaspirillum galbum]NEX63060.1 EAL domain-containing protein [Noviherbaspirillum galbum]
MNGNPSQHGSNQERATVRRLADEAKMIVWEATLEGYCTYLDPSSRQVIAAAGRVQTADWIRFIHPEDLPGAAAEVRGARAAQREYKVEYRILRSDGSTRWVMGTGAPRFDAEGALCGYFGSIVDITEHHEAQALLQRSEAEHRLLTEHARDLISHSDASDVYVYASPSHRDILGYEPAELIGTHLYRYIHPDDLGPPPAGQEDERSQANGAATRQRGLVKIRFRHKAGHWVWLSASTRTVRDRDTGAKIGIVSVARDITAQLDAERELARREERFRSLTSLSSDWYWETGLDQRFSFLSEGIYKRLNIDPESLLGTRFEASVADLNSPGFQDCMAATARREPFRDVVYPVTSPDYPGVIRFIRVSGEPIFEQGEFRGYRGVSRDVTREVRTAKALERLATSDVLTELPNRALLQTCLEQRLSGAREGSVQAVFFIDLDDFKEVNDSLGHGAGDQLLKEIARRLVMCLRPDDMVARLGGDEFVVLAECSEGADAARHIAERVVGILDAPAIIEGHEVKASASIGISMAPMDGVTSDVLLQNADIALYRAKAAGGGSFRFYTPDMGEASRARMAMQSALRHALERGEFEVYYQPRVDLRTMETTGMEALLRWHHPVLGEVPPAQFIPLAEEIGMIDAIGHWVLQQAAVQAQAWCVRFGRAVKMSVNLSARQLRSRRLMQSVRQALQASGLPPQQLELELTETALMDDPAMAATLLTELKSLGIRLSVDDFGTGYSSLAYLCRFPLDSLKLDRSFLQIHPGDVSPWRLAEAIINLAHTLKLSVVAEGVETTEHLHFLRSTSCDEIQGSCVSDPVPAAQFEAFMEAGIAQSALSL